MRMRELKYPVLRQSVFGLTGSNSLIPRSHHWFYIVANDVVSGRSDEDIYYDCSGGMFSVDRFLLSDPSRVKRFLRKAGDLFIFKPERKFHFASLDADLALIRQFTLEEFCAHIRDFSLSQRDWWTEYATEQDFQTMFDGCTTFEQAMGRVIRLEARKLPKVPKGGSTKLLDCRTVREPTWY